MRERVRCFLLDSLVVPGLQLGLNWDPFQAGQDVLEGDNLSQGLPDQDHIHLHEEDRGLLGRRLGQVS